MKKRVFIISGFFALIVILANIQNIVAYTKYYSFENNKEVHIKTKVVNFDDMFNMLTKQRELIDELEKTPSNAYIVDEIREGIDEASVHERFLGEGRQNKSIKVKLPVTSYNNEEITIEFISGRGEVLEIYENKK